MSVRSLARVLITLACAGTLAGCPAEGPSAAQPAPAPAPAAAGPDGATLFLRTCSACHGEGGEGVESLGKDMTSSAFIRGKTDAELVAFLKEGRAADHPDNTTMVPMPPYGGNTSLTDDDLQAIVVHMRTLMKAD
jgi:cytochrome c5